MGALKGGEVESRGVTRPASCEVCRGGNSLLYHSKLILSRGFAKKVFRKIFGKSVDNADTAVYNERRQAETAGKTEGEKKYDNRHNIG